MSGRRFSQYGHVRNGGNHYGARPAMVGKDYVEASLNAAYRDATSKAERSSSSSSERDVAAYSGQPVEAVVGEINLSKVVSCAAELAIQQLAAAWPDASEYDSLRSVVIEAFYRAFASSLGMRAGTIEGLLPALQPDGKAGFLAATRSLPYSDLTSEHFGAVHETLAGYRWVDGAIVPSDGRRKGGIHFTPRSLTEPIVRKTLEPLLRLVPPERTLELRVCDPSVGAGAFLLELVRQLGQRTLDGGLANTLTEAKRLVAIHCAYGVDVDRFAVASAKRAITLECRADQMPPTWLDDNIKCGDALVGLNEEQIRAFHWDPKKASNTLEAATGRAAIGRLLDEAMKLGVEGRKLRMAILSERARSA
jgi:hypothetical protein